MKRGSAFPCSYNIEQLYSYIRPWPLNVKLPLVLDKTLLYTSFLSIICIHILCHCDILDEYKCWDVAIIWCKKAYVVILLQIDWRSSSNDSDCCSYSIALSSRANLDWRVQNSVTSAVLLSSSWSCTNAHSQWCQSNWISIWSITEAFELFHYINIWRHNHVQLQRRSIWPTRRCTCLQRSNVR